MCCSRTEEVNHDVRFCLQFPSEWSPRRTKLISMSQENLNLPPYKLNMKFNCHWLFPMGWPLDLIALSHLNWYFDILKTSNIVASQPGRVSLSGLKHSDIIGSFRGKWPCHIVQTLLWLLLNGAWHVWWSSSCCLPAKVKNAARQDWYI